MINTRSIQFRLILWYSTLVVAVLLAFGAYIYRQVESGLYTDLEYTLQRRGSQIAVDILPQLSQRSPQEIAREIREVYSPEATGRFIRIRRTDASVLYLSGAPDGGLFDPARIDSGMPASHKRTITLSNGGKMLVVAVPARIGADNFLVEMGGTTAEIEGVLARLVGTLLTGLSLASSTVIAATDTVLAALQGEFTVHVLEGQVRPQAVDVLPEEIAHGGAILRKFSGSNAKRLSCQARSSATSPS